MEEEKNKNLDEKLDTILNDLEGDGRNLSNEADMDSHDAERLRDVLLNIQSNIQRILRLIPGGSEEEAESPMQLRTTKTASAGASSQRIIEGVFNGEMMMDSEGKKYNVPANYASKSKLIEGDILKLTITKDGSFIYKQIGPIERKQLIATLGYDEASEKWYAVQGDKRWKLLTASVTYFNGEAGDEVVILVPKKSASNWAAVENIIKK